MSIEKALYALPQGVSEPDTPALVVEVVDESLDELLPVEGEEGTDEDFDDNLAEQMSEEDLDALATDLLDAVEQDTESRKDWEKAYVEGIKLLGLQYEVRTTPWQDACGVYHPMLAEAVVRFQSETITEMFPAAGPVRTKILGKETTEKKEAARRVEEDLNYELTEVMREFRPEHERMLWSLPATGSAFKKVYYDPGLGRQVSMFVPAEDIVLPYGTTDLDSCYRLTHVMRKPRNEVLKLQRAGFYRDIELADTVAEETDIQKAKDKETGFSDTNDDRDVLCEIHVDWDLKGFEDVDAAGEPTGIALPYVVTINRGTRDVLAIRRNWLEKDVHRNKRQHFVHYQYIPGFGAYGFGLFHLIGGFAKSATSIMRQLVDSGTLSNLPGGLKSRNLRVKGDDSPIAPGEFRDVDVVAGTLRDSILPLPYKEPSAVLSGLLDKIVEEGRRFAATADMNVSDMNAQAPVGTTLALLERQLKVMTAVQARLHYAFKQELRLLAGIIRDYTEQDYDFEPEEGKRTAKAADYSCCDIIPVSDPNAATLAQRLAQYQAVVQMSQMAPDIYDLPLLHRGMLEVLGVKNAEKLVPLEEDMRPRDPVSENQSILNCAPVKAFLHQDHASHIAVHMAMIQDPHIQQLIGQNPKASQMQAALMAHVAEHTAFAYRQQIEQHMGVALPPEDDKAPPQVEIALSAMMAKAAQQALQANQAQAAQQQAQQQAQDPVVQMQQQELGVKQQEVALKGKELELKQVEAQSRMALEQKRLELDAAAQADKLRLEELRIQVDAADRADKAEQGQGTQKSVLEHQIATQKHTQDLQHKQQRHEQDMAHKDERLLREQVAAKGVDE